MSPVFLLTAVFLPLVGGFLLGVMRLSDRWNKIVSYAVVVLTSVLTWVFIFAIRDQTFTLLEILPHYRISLRFDSLGKIFAGMVSLLWPFALMYAFGYMKQDERRRNYISFYVMTYGVVLGLAFSENLLTMFIFYEILTFITLPLIVHTNTSEARRAGRYYLYFSLSGSSLSLVGMIMLTQYLGTNGFHLMLEATTAMEDSFYQIGFLLCFFGFGVKSALFPLHFWLPMASAAPTPTTALLHAVAIVKAGVFALIRITYYNNGVALMGTWVQQVMIVFACITVVYGSAMALKEQHLKRRFAYSTISNLSYIILAMSFMNQAGLVAALLHLIIHSITKICLFFCCGEIIENSGATYVYQLDGFFKKMPLTFVSFVLASCSITGIPLFAGFVSKYYILSSSILSGTAFSYLGMGCIILSAVMTAIYSLSVPFRAIVHSVNENNAELLSKANEKDREMLVPIVVFAILTVIFGIGSGWLVDLLVNLFAL